MPSQPRQYDIQREPCPVRDHLADQDWQSPASGYRLAQAEALLREMGYVPHGAGTWQLPGGGNPATYVPLTTYV